MTLPNMSAPTGSSNPFPHPNRSNARVIHNPRWEPRDGFREILQFTGAHASENGNRSGKKSKAGVEISPSNLFVDGLHPKMIDSDIVFSFGKYGDVENVDILLDPHSKESRGMGFVKMATVDQANAAMAGLQGKVIGDHTLFIEKARSARNATLKKHKEPEKKSMSQLSAKEFAERMKLFQSASVVIVVGAEEVVFTFPKDLVCYNSRYFEAGFNGNFKESEGKIEMKEDSVAAFEMMAQWIYTGAIRLTGSPAKQLDSYVDFLKLADKVDLLGPFDSVIASLRLILNLPQSGEHGSPASQVQSLYGADWAAPLPEIIIQPHHIEDAFELPSGHGLRTAFVDACVDSYLQSASIGSRHAFKFQAELEKVDGFSVELLKAVAQVVGSGGSHVMAPERTAHDAAYETVYASDYAYRHFGRINAFPSAPGNSPYY